MDMIRQQTVTEKPDFFDLTVVNQLLQVPVPIAIVLENVLPIVAAAYDVVNGTGIFNT
jgi:hypothetical protein